MIVKTRLNPREISFINLLTVYQNEKERGI